ncbi:DUF7617 domain-containing protein [Hamadaea tsunoensis]|uniref:DUF7617 domain-containing protein n=1 Tax=Hamadaea tsunoensis TaxID=53368 RepID=UPI0004085723|nr:hypothetical protein [Hamadaea tsunoensis]
MRPIPFLATGLLVTLTLAAPTPATALALAEASTLTKSAQNVTSPGADPANHGDVINWTLAYDDKATPGSATITDALQAGQSFVPGSLKVPPGWSPAWSTDGTTFTGTEPASGVAAVRATNPTARDGGTNLTHFLLPPVQTTATATGGDGFTPIIYRDQNGAVESWNMYHHLAAANAKLVCVDLLTNALCAGGPWPRPVNTTPGPLGTGSTGNIQSTLEPVYARDPAHPERVYYPAVTSTGVGAACLDLEARANCGYVELESRASTPGLTGLEGFVNVGGNLYGASTTGDVLCLNLAALTPCPSQPYAPVATPTSNGGLYQGSVATANGLVFISSSPSGGPARLGCFDPATTAACTGWATPKIAGPASSSTYSAFASYTTAGTPNGACVPANNGGTPAVTCFAFDGSALTAPVFGALPNGVLTFNPETVTAPNGHLQSYFPFWGGSLAGGTGCYDWTSAAICAGFPFPKTHPTVNGGATRDYGYAYDATTECLVGLGDAGYLFSVDPATGGTPCIRSGASVTLNPGAFYCDGKPHTQAYTKARLTDITLSNVDLGASTATVTDPGGNVLATPAFAPDGTLDLSGISPAAQPSITVNARLVLLSTADFTGGNQPSLVVEYTGDAPQVCFRTTLSTTCSVTAVSNTGTGQDPGGQLTSNTVNLPIAPGQNCRPDVSVNKEICADLRASHCGPSGPGPWVKNSPAGLLGLLGNAYWRITVTNNGQVAATNVTVNDSVAPGCASAAGTFTLAPGASKQVFCSTFLLVLPLTNTASASYGGANFPPTTSAPSSATACSLVCILLPQDQRY